VLGPGAEGLSEHTKINATGRQMGGKRQAMWASADNSYITNLGHAGLRRSNLRRASQRWAETPLLGAQQFRFPIPCQERFLQSEGGCGKRTARMPCKILISTTVKWASTARHAWGFAAAGCIVDCVAPADAPVTKSRYISNVHPYR